MRDLNGEIFAGAKAYFYEATTQNPIIVYQDYGLGEAHPNPVQANAYGVFPAVFFDEADEFYRQRITTSGGIIIPGTDVGTLPIIGPSGGGGGSEVPVDPNALFLTGDLIWLDQAGSRAGWVRDNGRTIGSAISGASERANADCEALFLFLWNTYADTICAVTSGRGVSAAADFAANKPIAVPDKRGRSPFGLDDMGNAAAGRFTGVPFTLGNDITPGSLGGETRHQLLATGLPAHTHAATITDTHRHRIANVTSDGLGAPVLTANNYLIKDYSAGGGASAYELRASAVEPTLGLTSAATFGSITASVSANTGGGGQHNNTPLFALGSFYRKL